MNLTISAKNVLAFGEKGIEFELPTKGLTLVRGQHLSSQSKTTNGVGKSSLLDVVLWGIYGSIPKGRRKSDIMNAEADSDCIVDIFINLNGKTSRIVRTLSADEYKVNEVPIVGDTLAFFIDDKDCRGCSDKETQVAIEGFIGLDEESFRASAWFTADKESFADKTPAKQDQLFLKLLRLEVLDAAQKVTKDLSKEITDKIDGLGREYASNEKALAEIETTKNSLKESVEQWKRNKEYKLAQLTDRIATTGQKICDTKFEIETADKTLTSLQLDLKNFVYPQGNEEDYQKKAEELDKELSEANTSLGKISGDIERNQKLLRSAQSLEEGTRCPKCGTELTDKHLFTYRDELNEEIEEKEVELTEQKKLIQKIRGSVSENKEVLNSFVKAQNDERELKMKIHRWSDKKQSSEHSLAELESTLRGLNQDKEELEDTKPPQQKETKQLENRIIELEEELEDLTGQKKTLVLEKERLDFWITGFGSQGIRNLLVRSAIPALNQNANEFSKILTNGELSIEFSGEQEVGSGSSTETRNKLNVKASDVYGSDKYATASGGERRRIDLCVDLALHFLVEERTGLPFLFIDEIFTKLDGLGKELVLVLLRKLTERIPGIIVVSNQDDVVSEEFDNIFTVFREGKQSWLVKN